MLYPGKKKKILHVLFPLVFMMEISGFYVLVPLPLGTLLAKKEYILLFWAFVMENLKICNSCPLPWKLPPTRFLLGRKKSKFVSLVFLKFFFVIMMENFKLLPPSPQCNASCFLHLALGLLGASTLGHSRL